MKRKKPRTVAIQLTSELTDRLDLIEAHLLAIRDSQRKMELEHVQFMGKVRQSMSEARFERQIVMKAQDAFRHLEDVRQDHGLPVEATNPEYWKPPTAKDTQPTWWRKLWP